VKLVMIRHLLAAALVGAASLAAYGCSGYSSDEAKERCDAEQSARASCFGAKIYSECLTCFEDCGDSCVATDSCPTHFVCPDDANATGQQAE
jgi:hypothetical protein